MEPWSTWYREALNRQLMTEIFDFIGKNLGIS